MGSDDSETEQVILATGGYDHTIRFWQAHSGQCQGSVQHSDSQVNALEITPDRQLLAAASYQHIRMYDINSNNPNPVVNYEGVSKNVTSVGFQETGRWMYTGGEDCMARVWDLRSRNLQCQKLYNTHQPIGTVCLHPNQIEIYVGDQSGAIHVWDLRMQQNDPQTKPIFYKSTETDVSIQNIHIDSEGTYVAAVDNKGYCYLFSIAATEDGKTPQPLRQLKLQAHKRYALKCKFSPDSTLLVTTSADATGKIWRTADLQLLMSQKETANQEILIHNWKATEVTPMVELKDVNQRWVWDVAFSADSQYAITASSDNLARLWSVTTGEMKREYSGHQKALTALAFRD